MLSNLLCFNACNSRSCKDPAAKGEDCPDADVFYDAWQEEMTEFDKMVDKSGGGSVLFPLCRTGHALCLPTATTCGVELGSCAGPSHALATSERESSGPVFTAFGADPMNHEALAGRVDLGGGCPSPHRQGPDTPFVEIQAMPVLPPVLFEEELPGPGTFSLGEDVPALTGHLHRAAASDRCVSNDGVLCGREGTNDSGMFLTQWRGRCGFVTRLRFETPDGPWMCHHFTVDGEHCVSLGLGPEHANSCAGVCRMIETETFEDLADPPRCMGLRKPLDGPGAPTLIKCGLASGPCCTPSNCPFLSKGRMCPFVKKAAANRRSEPQTAMFFSPQPASGILARHRGANLRANNDGILIEPEPDDDMSPIDNSGDLLL